MRMRIWSERLGWLLVATTMYLATVDCVKTKVDRSRKKPTYELNQQQQSQQQQRTLVTNQDKSLLNLCSKERDMKLICHCSPIEEDRTLVADCWIYREDLPENDPSWKAFEAKRSILNLTLTVHGQGNLSYIPTQVMKILRNLTSLTVSYSQIREVAHFALANLTQLTRVDIVNNSHLALLQNYAFSNHPHLLILNLERNSLQDIEQNTFSSLPVLDKLFLNDNNLTYLSEGVFTQLGRLSELDLSSNQISSITRHTLKGLGSLNIFKLTSNNLSFIGDTAFAELWSLTELYLNSNRIERISERAFDGLNTLTTLNLSHNRLLFLEIGIFTVVPALNNLDLNDNHLETLSYNNFYPIYENLLKQGSTLDISVNHFTCDCRLNWIFELRNRTKNKKLKKSLQDVECMLFSKELKSTREKSSSNNNPNYGLVKPPSHFMGDPLQNLDYHHQQRQQQQRQQHGLGGQLDTFDIRLESMPGIVMTRREEIESDNAINPNGGIMTQLLKVKPEDLPCPQTETIVGDPTELPLSPEKVVKDVYSNYDTPKPSSHSDATRLFSISYSSKLLALFLQLPLYVIIAIFV